MESSKNFKDFLNSVIDEVIQEQIVSSETIKGCNGRKCTECHLYGSCSKESTNKKETPSGIFNSINPDKQLDSAVDLAGNLWLRTASEWAKRLGVVTIQTYGPTLITRDHFLQNYNYRRRHKHA